MYAPSLTRSVATISAATLLSTGLSPAADAEEEIEPIAAELLTERHAFTDDVSIEIRQTVDGLPEQVIDLQDATNMLVVRFTIQPGAIFPWHTHPGSVLISIVEGDFVFIYAEDCIERNYTAGDALIDPGFDNVHTAYNPAQQSETVVMAVLLGAPEDGALTLPVDETEGADLDEACGIDRQDFAHAP